MKRFLVLLFSLSATMPATGSAPHSILRGRVLPGQWESYSLRLTGTDRRMELETDDNGNFAVEWETEAPVIVMLSGVVGEGNAKWQFRTPVMLTPGADTEFDILLTDRRIKSVSPQQDADNRAFSEYRDFSLDKAAALWKDTPEDAAAMLASYAAEAQRLTNEYGISAEAGDFLNFWVAVDLFDAYSVLKQTRSRSGVRMDPPVLTETPKILDNPFAMLFYSAPRHVLAYILDKSSGLSDQIENLRSEFETPALVTAVSDILLERFITGYDYSRYDEGLAILESIIGDLPGRERYLGSFRKRRFAIEGALLPDAQLKDRDGNNVKLSDFEGKYVYIDLWASWCVPCCAEIPHLQKLETELRNKQVVFVSVSLDTDEDAWRNAMERFGMHGNQLIDADGTLGDMLNVTSIPHFLLYGKDSRMMEYKAPRPSSGSLLKEKLEKLP